MNSLKIIPEQRLFTRGLGTTRVLKRFLSSSTANRQPTWASLHRIPVLRNNTLLCAPILNHSVRVSSEVSHNASHNMRLYHNFNGHGGGGNPLLSNPRVKTGVAVSVGVASLFLIQPLFYLALNGAVGYGVYRIFRSVLDARYPSQNVRRESIRRVKIQDFDKY